MLALDGARHREVLDEDNAMMHTAGASALAQALNALFLGSGPKLGRRFLCGQARCTEYVERDGETIRVDRSEVRNALANKYMPHQGKREMDRRRRQMARAKR